MLRARFFTDFRAFLAYFLPRKKGDCGASSAKDGRLHLGNYFKCCRRATLFDHGRDTHDADDDADADDDDDATKKRIPFSANFRARLKSVGVCVPHPLRN